MTTVETYQEVWEYSWVKSKANICECEAVQSFNKLLPPDFYPQNHFVYVIDEKQLYTVKARVFSPANTAKLAGNGLYLNLP